MAISIVAYIMLAAVAGITFITYLKSKDTYQEDIAALDKQDFSLKDYLPIGLYLNEHFSLIQKLPYSLQRIYNKHALTVKAHIGNLYGLRYSDYFYAIHCASRTLMALLVLLGTFALGSLLCIQGNSGDAPTVMIGGVLLAIGIFYFYDKSLADKIAAKELKIRMEFPEFLNKLLLLVNAGMTISRAFSKIMDDNKKDTPLYTELNITYGEIKAGKNEALAFEDFARRCKIREIINFISVLVLNLKRGGAEIVPVLRAQSTECWEMRKTAAKRLGEEASSKLMLPITIMLVGILLVVGAPAVLMMTSGM